MLAVNGLSLDIYTGSFFRGAVCPMWGVSALSDRAEKM